MSSMMAAGPRSSPVVSALAVMLVAAKMVVGSGGQLAQAQTTDQDRAALQALYNATGGANWTTSTNWNDANTPLSQWHGITTNDDGRVTDVDLTNNNLVGTLPAQLGNLTALNNLALGQNSLSGSIPSAIGTLPNLWGLYLNQNNLTGAIPSSLGNTPNLLDIIVNDNQLSGRRACFVR